PLHAHADHAEADPVAGGAGGRAREEPLGNGADRLRGERRAGRRRTRAHEFTTRPIVPFHAHGVSNVRGRSIMQALPRGAIGGADVADNSTSRQRARQTRGVRAGGGCRFILACLLGALPGAARRCSSRIGTRRPRTNGPEGWRIRAWCSPRTGPTSSRTRSGTAASRVLPSRPLTT